MSLPRPLQGLLIGLIGGAIGLVYWSAGALDRLEARTYDWRAARLARPAPTTDRIRLILLDQASLDWAQSEYGLGWPWPRELHAAIIAFCRLAEARALAMDVLFTEPSVYGVEDDRRLGSTMAEGLPTVAPLFAAHATGAATAWPAAVPRPDRLRAGDAFGPAPRLPRAVFPIAEVAQNSAVPATVFGNPDADGITRRLAPFVVFDGVLVPSLGIAAWLAGSPLGPAPRLLRSGGGFDLDGHRVPVDAHGAALLRYRGPSQTHRAYNAAQVIEAFSVMQDGRPSPIPLEGFRDRYVLYGFSAPGLMDLKATPVSPIHTGVEIHATMLDNLLAGDILRHAPVPATAACVLLLALAVGVLLRLARTPLLAALVLFLTLPIPALLGLAAYRAGFWLPMTPMLAAWAHAVPIALLVNHAVEGRQKRFIKNAFAQYLSPLVIDALIREPDRLQLGGVARELTIFFSDLEGFTSLSEGLSPQALTHLLNTYLTAMTEVIHGEGGTIDKYEGDAIIAFWNAPVPQPDHAARAVRAALTCTARLRAMQPELSALAPRPFNARIGLNTGTVVVGNMGSRLRFDYTFLGDAGNLASRLEGANKILGSRVLVSAFTQRQLPDGFRLRDLGAIRVVGRSQALRVFEPLDARQAEEMAPLLAEFADALERYERGAFDEARARFERWADQDGPSRAYAAHCQRLALTRPEAWDGVWTLTEK